jgi:hypothetical protein
MSTLDWHDLVIEGELHWCGCDYCPMDGEHEDDEYPTLARMAIGGVIYVTDRRLAIRENLAPIPDGWPTALAGEPFRREASGMFGAQLLDEPSSAYFQRRYLDVVAKAGWKLRRLSEAEREDARAWPAAIVASSGLRVGWLMPVLAPSPERDAQYKERGGR